MTYSKSEKDYFVLSRDLSRVERAIKRNRDVIIVSPPMSGLSEYLLQVKEHIQKSEIFNQHNLIFIDGANLKDLNTLAFLKGGFSNVILSQLEGLEVQKWDPSSRLADFFSGMFLDNPNLRLIVLIDNLHMLGHGLLGDFLEQIRVIAESNINNVKFVIGGHSINLREWDPEHNSPFNIADRIWLDDFSTEQTLLVVEKALFESPIEVSKYVPRYIDFLSSGHPYIVQQICSHLMMVNDLLGTSPKKISFKVVDEVVKMICRDGSDRLSQLIKQKITIISKESQDLLKNILKGCRYDAIKTSHQIEELRLVGLISNSRSNIWHIRNEIYELYIRKITPYSKIAIQPIPRRLFINIEGYRILFGLENDIRDFIISKMFITYPDKWESKFDPNLVGKWSNLKNEELRSGWYASEDFPTIAYSLFPELRKVIEDEHNWSAIFHKHFKPKDVFVGYFSNLEALRNKIAHNRPLNDKDIERLSEISDAFHNCMYD
jgi:hypothetical protein